MQRFTLNTEQVNRYGFRVLTSGLALENFKANPVMFYAHDRSRLPIGTWKDIKVEQNGNLTAEPSFDENDPFALQIKDKVEQGILKAASLNFNIMATSDDPQNLLAGQKYPTVTQCEPWEASIVDIPGNPGCMRLSYQGIEIGGDLSLTLDSIMKPVSIHKQISNHKMKELALALGLEAEATEKEIIEAVVALSAEKKPAKAAAASADENLTESLVAIGRRTGFVTDSNEAIIKALAAIDFANTLKLVSEAPAASTGATAKPSGKAESIALALAKLGGQQEKEGGKGIPKGREEWTHRDWEKKDPKGLAKLKAEFPETQKELFDAEYKA